MNNINTIILGVLVVLSAGTIVTSNFYFTNQIKNTVEQVNTLQFGGKENYKLAKEVFTSTGYKKQQRKQLQRVKQRFGGSDTNTKSANNQDNTRDKTSSNNDSSNTSTSNLNSRFQSGKIGEDKIQEVLDNGIVEGKDSEVVWLEYSDIQCPFCQRQKNNGTIEKVRGQFPNKIGYSYRNFAVKGPTSQKGGQAIACVGELSDSKENYFSFIKQLFNSSNPANKKEWSKLASENGVNESEFNKCLNSGRKSNVVSSHRKEGKQVFNVTGTPGNVLLDTQTGEYILIPGAYPASEFKPAVKKLLNS